MPQSWVVKPTSRNFGIIQAGKFKSSENPRAVASKKCIGHKLPTGQARAKNQIFLAIRKFCSFPPAG